MIIHASPQEYDEEEFVAIFRFDKTSSADLLRLTEIPAMVTLGNGAKILSELALHLTIKRLAQPNRFLADCLPPGIGVELFLVPGRSGNA